MVDRTYVDFVDSTITIEALYEMISQKRVVMVNKDTIINMAYVVTVKQM